MVIQKMGFSLPSTLRNMISKRIGLVFIVLGLGLILLSIHIHSHFHGDLLAHTGWFPNISRTHHYRLQTPGHTDPEEENRTDMEYLLQYRHIEVPRLFYNRVPKCGSEAVRYIILRLSWLNDFEYYTSRIFTSYSINSSQQVAFVEDFHKFKVPLLYERHLYFVDFEKHGAEAPVYTNVVRDPIDRLVSWYYFIRFQPGHKRKMSKDRRNMTYDECVLRNDPECTDELNYFTIIPFFCGQSPQCRHQSQWSLARAKRNVAQFYMVVGLSSDLTNYFTVLEYLQPKFFNESASMFNKVSGKLKRIYGSVVKAPALPQTRHIMRQKLKLEYEFYLFLEQRFYQLLHLVKKARQR